MFPLLIGLLPVIEGLAAGHAITTILAGITLAQYLGIAGDVVTLLDKDPNVQAFLQKNEDQLKAVLPHLPSLPTLIQELKAYAASNKQSGTGFPPDYLAPSQDKTDYAGRAI